MKRIFWGLLVLLALIGAGGVYVSIKYGEHEGVPLDSMKARLAFPLAIRTVPMEMACSEAVLSRSWIECGGVCGTTYSFAYESTAESGVLIGLLEKHVSVEFAGHEFSANASPQSAPGECRPVVLHIWQDSRDVQ